MSVRGQLPRASRVSQRAVMRAWALARRQSQDATQRLCRRLGISALARAERKLQQPLIVATNRVESDPN
jgi:hypothetical protein